MHVIRPCVCVFAIALGGCSGKPDSDLMTRIQESEKQFIAATKPDEFLKVAGTYERLLAEYPNNPGLLYNQGNAFFQAGRKAEAIACYRRALRYRPRDENLRANLIVVAGPVAFGEPTTFERVFFWQNWLGYREKFTSLIAAASVTFALSLFRLRNRELAWILPALCIGLAATIVMLASTTFDVYRFERTRHGIANREGVMTHSGPGDNYPKEFPVPFGVEFEILESRPGSKIGQLIRLPDGKTGWIADAIEY